MARKSPPLTLNYFFGNTSALVESDLLKNRTQRCKLHEREKRYLKKAAAHMLCRS
jgi:hypothetical protein